MSPTLDFRTSAEGGNLPMAAWASARLMGRDANPDDVARGLGKAVAEGVMRPVNLLAATTRVAPGGRDPNEINPVLLAGVDPYKPKDDMFGAPVAPGAR